MVNFRTVKIRMSPKGKNGVNLSLWPHVMNWKIDNRLQVNSGKCSGNYSPVVDISRDDVGYAVVSLKGKYSTNCGPQELTVVMGEASEQFYYLFRDLWTQMGGSFDGGGQLAKVPNTAKLFYTGLSLPLSEQIQLMNQHSNNVMTRQLMLTLGVYTYGVPGSLEKGREAVFETLRAFGVPLKDAVIDNGAGLSRITRVSAQDFQILLQGMYDSEFSQPFLASLAIAGEEGTLRKRFRGEALSGKVFGKTGTLDNVRGFAGYVRSKSGRVYIVVMLGNGASALPSRYMQDDVFRWVYGL